jgi:hypothetical protein
MNTESTEIKKRVRYVPATDETGRAALLADGYEFRKVSKLGSAVFVLPNGTATVTSTTPAPATVKFNVSYGSTRVASFDLETVEAMIAAGREANREVRGVGFKTSRAHLANMLAREERRMQAMGVN